jgi:2'-5' RNA ligase
MRYSIAFLLTGEAGSWHKDLTREISEQFNTWKIHEYIPPHVTLYRPFEVEHIDAVKALLKEWVHAKRASGNVSVSGFGRFDDRVIFADIHVDPAVQAAVMELRQLVQGVPGMPEEDIPVWRPHATLMHKISEDEIKTIWEFVHTKTPPQFTCAFDALTLLRFSEEEQCWKIDETFRFDGTG